MLVVSVDERSKLLGYHDEEPGSQAEAKSMGSGLENFPFKGLLEESRRLRVNGKVEVRVLKLMLYIHIPGRRASQEDSAEPC